jgi:hypothetical protein
MTKKTVGVIVVKMTCGGRGVPTPSQLVVGVGGRHVQSPSQLVVGVGSRDVPTPSQLVVGVMVGTFRVRVNS